MSMHIYKKQVLLAVGPQNDYFLGEGKACIRNHRRVLSHFRRVMALARREHMPIISICEIHPNVTGNGSDSGPCIAGTWGQRMIRYGLIRDRQTFVPDNKITLQDNIFWECRQHVFHMRGNNPFEEPLISRFFEDRVPRGGKFIIIGAPLETSVKLMALGLLYRSKKVTIVIDAVGYRSGDKNLTLNELEAKGAELIETKELVGQSNLRQVSSNMCRCLSCKKERGKRGLPAMATSGSSGLQLTASRP